MMGKNLRSSRIVLFSNFEFEFIQEMQDKKARKVSNPSSSCGLFSQKCCV